MCGRRIVPNALVNGLHMLSRTLSIVLGSRLVYDTLSKAKNETPEGRFGRAQRRPQPRPSIARRSLTRISVVSRWSLDGASAEATRPRARRSSAKIVFIRDRLETTCFSNKTQRNLPVAVRDGDEAEDERLSTRRERFAVCARIYGTCPVRSARSIVS